MTLLGYFWDRWPYFAGKLSWDVTTTQVNSALHPAGVAESSTSFGWGKGGKVTSAGWQVTLCDPIWRVISRSGVVISITNCYIRVYFTLLSPCSTVVRNCYKGDVASQWEIAIFGHLGLLNPWTDRVEIWHNWLCPRRDNPCQFWWQSVG